MAKTGSTSVAVTSHVTLKFSWVGDKQSIADNQTSVSWKLELITDSSGQIISSYDKTWEVVVNKVKYSGKNRINMAKNATKTLASGTTLITHDTDGTKTFDYSFSQLINVRFSGVLVETISGSGKGVLDPIARQAEITESPSNWTDEDNPTIKYSNPAGDAIKISACISSDKYKIEVPYREIDPKKDSYTFALTAAEREALQKVTLNGSASRTVYFFIKSEIGDVIYYSFEESTLTIDDCAPLLTPTVKDINPKTTALTGDDSILVRYRSTAQVSTGATAQKHATLTNQSITCGRTTIRSSSGEIEKVETNKFDFVASDNRGLVSSQILLTDFVEYVELTCSQRVTMDFDDSVNSIGEADKTIAIAKIAITGNYFNGHFDRDGNVYNTLDLWYRYKKVGEEWSADSQDRWQKVDTFIGFAEDSPSYIANVEIAGLEYSQQYVFQCKAADRLNSEIDTPEYATQTTPVFDWGENDFNFNVPVTIMGSPVTPSANRYIYSTPGVAGTAGYIKMAQLTHKKANADTPITFVFTRRLEASPMTVHVQFKSNSTTVDPDLKDIKYEGSNYGAFIVRTAESVWELYVQKVSAYDTITLHTWFSSGTVEDRLIVEFPGELVSSLPAGLNGEGYYRATPIVSRSIIDCFMPVGYILTLYSHADPNTMYPGTTWERIVNRFLWACDENGDIGTVGGEKTHTLTVNELPAHTHGSVYSGNASGTKTHAWLASGGSAMAYGTISTGGGQAHNNMPPYIQVSIWRRTA